MAMTDVLKRGIAYTLTRARLRNSTSAIHTWTNKVGHDVPTLGIQTAAPRSADGMRELVDV